MKLKPRVKMNFSSANEIAHASANVMRHTYSWHFRARKTKTTTTAAEPPPPTRVISMTQNVKLNVYSP